MIYDTMMSMSPVSLSIFQTSWRFDRITTGVQPQFHCQKRVSHVDDQVNRRNNIV